VSLPRPRLEVAWTADPSSDPSTWEYDDVDDPATVPAGETGRLLVPAGVSVRRGQADRSSRPQPASGTVQVDNRDGRLTPDHPASDLWPNVDIDRPARLGIEAGATQAALTRAAGSRLRTPSHASLHITGDLFLIFDITVPSWPVSGVSWKLWGRYVPSGDERSWLVRLTENRTVILFWSTDGTLGGATQVGSDVLVTPWSGRVRVGIWLDADDGAGGHAVTFYQAATISEL
jgi:hypothetical protein